MAVELLILVAGEAATDMLEFPTVVKICCVP
jgi:hypothetical protein